MKPGWYKRNRYQGLAHWFDKGHCFSLCRRMNRGKQWRSDKEGFIPIPPTKPRWLQSLATTVRCVCAGGVSERD